MKRLVLGLVMLAGSTVLACGPTFPNTYLMFGQEGKVLRLPSFRIKNSIETSATKLPRHRESRGWSQTSNANHADMFKALDGHERQEELTEKYVALHRAMKIQYDGSEKTSRFYDNSRQIEGRFDLSAHEDLLGSIPIEFRFYTYGSDAYRAKQFEEAIIHWKKIVNLPGEERQFRGVWAEFMLGKAALHLDPKTAGEHFQAMRKMVQEDYPDPLELRSSSLGWEALGERNAGNYVRAAALYKKQIETGSPQDARTAFESIGSVTSSALSERPIRDELLADPLLGDLMLTAISNGGGRLIQGEEWINYLDEHRHSEVISKHVLSIAARSYRSGRLEDASAWIDRYEGDSPYGNWIRAKLALRDGDQDKAVRLLQESIDSFPVDEGEYRLSRASRIEADQGVLRLNRKEYSKALTLFLKSGYERDAAYIAFYVLTVDELKDYVESHPENQKEKVNGVYDTYQSIPSTRKILAIRYARDDNWIEATKYYSGYSQEKVSKLLKFKKRAEETSRSQRVRAKAYWSAAYTMYHNGHAITGIHPTYHSQVLIGRFSLGQSHESRMKTTRPRPFGNANDFLAEILLASEDEKARIEASHKHWELQFHSRYEAANLLWECAELLPDNDPMTARAFVRRGGDLLKAQDPQAADRFYKALVNRCRKLPIGQAADDKRWFPKEPPPLPEGLESIKRYRW